MSLEELEDRPPTEDDYNSFWHEWRGREEAFYLATHELVVANTSLVGVFAGGYAREELDAIHAQLSSLVADGRLRNAVTAEIPFAELPAALQRVADRAVVGKLVMVPRPQ